MIRINLLPADLRRGNRIAPKVLATAFVAAIAVSAAIGWFGIVYFGDLGDAEAKLQTVEAKLAEREKRVAYFDKLQANKKEYGSRVQTIADISKSRRLWSKFCDELIDVVNNNGDTERHLAWFDSITVKGDPKKGATVTMPGFVQDADKSRVANFHEDIEAAPFARDLIWKSDPTFKLETDASRVPPSSLRFPLVLQFEPPVGSTKAPAKTPGKK
ncbi:MAG TPA: hypothetical protein VFZ65_17405 [Planctomycetota bacterium]|nr:hypothetical protein [Planctomycetota bacterium]